jgi:hypothetical protein
MWKKNGVIHIFSIGVIFFKIGELIQKSYSNGMYKNLQSIIHNISYFLINNYTSRRIIVGILGGTSTTKICVKHFEFIFIILPLYDKYKKLY